MRSLASTALVLVLASCRSDGARQETVDTVMVFTANPPSARADSTARVPSRRQVAEALWAYAKQQMSADAAAKVIVDYQKKTGQSLNIPMDEQLLAAVRREQERRK